MDIAVVNAVIKNTKSEKIFHVLVISVEIRKVLLLEHYFMQKVREAMKSSESHKMNDRVQVDEFTIGGKEEYSFRINRSQNKDTIFNKLMKRIVERSPVSQSQLVCS